MKLFERGICDSSDPLCPYTQAPLPHPSTSSTAAAAATSGRFHCCLLGPPHFLADVLSQHRKHFHPASSYSLLMFDKNKKKHKKGLRRGRDEECKQRIHNGIGAHSPRSSLCLQLSLQRSFPTTENTRCKTDNLWLSQSSATLSVPRGAQLYSPAVRVSFLSVNSPETEETSVPSLSSESPR